MSWCTSGVELQVRLFIDNSHLGSILRFQRFPCCMKVIHELSDEPVLFCIYVCENVVLFMFRWPQGR